MHLPIPIPSHLLALLLLTLTLTHPTSATPLPTPDPQGVIYDTKARYNCTPNHGVFMFLLRASTAPVDGGVLLPLSQSIAKLIPQSSYKSIKYPATLHDYEESVYQGVAMLGNALERFTKQCPSSSVVLLGYSQGAQVIGDTLIGNPGFGSPGNGLAAEWAKNIIAIVQMGDPTYIANLSIDKGTSTKNGTFPRQNAQLYSTDHYAPKMQSYCDTDDLWCASGTSTIVHHSYVEDYSGKIEAFVLAQACKKCKANVGKGSVSAECAFCTAAVV